jgi:hypothetical protein
MQNDAEQLLVNEIIKLKNDFYKLVLFLFPWGEVGTPLEGHSLEDWQKDFLIEVSKQIQENNFNGFDPVEPLQDGTASGHGIGKSALVAMLVYCIMSTRPMCRGTITANTFQQLKTKTFAELSKWHNMAINKHWFDFSGSALRLSAKAEDLKDVWYAQGQTCREENSESFAGQHTASSTSFYIFDEASAVPDKIWEVAEGGLVKGEPMFFVFGNPTRNTGAFRECFRKNRKRWNTRQIDSRSVRGSNKGQIEKWADDHGEDSDFMRVRVRGVFPRKSTSQFISEQLVEDSLNRKIDIKQYNFAPTIISVDPSWTGEDPLVIGKRQGLHFEILEEIQYNDNDIEIGNKIARYEDRYNADAVFIDLGYGTGIASFGKTIGRDWVLVSFSGKVINEGYKNKRAEMWGEAKEWLKEGGKIEPNNQILEDLTGVETKPTLDGKIQLESKQDMKKRGLPSPNTADALALTFAFPVSNMKPKQIVEYNDGW